MKIGILTFHKALNYGAVLQVYALQTKLEAMGHRVEVIDYEPKAHKSKYGVITKGIVKGIVRDISSVRLIKIRARQKKSFERFSGNYLNLSRHKYYDEKQAERLNQEYDCIITGSDQVWNVKLRDCDPIFFLPITHKAKKIAYAVSYNDTRFDDSRYGNKLRDMILDYDHISVREQSGADGLKEYLGTNKEIVCMPDPTLLHDRKIYDAFTGDRIISKPYIFYYSVVFTKDSLNAVSRISKIYNKPVYTVVSNINRTKYNEAKVRGITIIESDQSPESFINYIKYSDMVFTDSFHGTAFSVILEKNFYSYNRFIEKEKRYKNDERITGLLQTMHLYDRYLKDTDLQKLNKEDFEKEVDFSYSKTVRQELVSNTVNWLKHAIEN